MANTKDNKEILFILENLGRLPNNFDGDCLVPLTQNSSDQIRLWTVKNLGKLKTEKYLDLLKEIAQKDTDSMVRRESVSSIGRMRSPNAIPFLLQSLQDTDPKVALQALRALLVFKAKPEVQAELTKLRSHPNEIIQSVIAKELSPNDHQKKAKAPHPASPEFMQNVVVLGDVRDTLHCVPDDSIHLTFTSPPYYNARDYSIYESYSAYLDFLTDVFREVHRITKEGRFFIINTSPVIIPRFSRAHASKRYPIPFDIHARDLIFDPFAGSGTLGKAAQHLDRYFFLTEKEPSYFERIKQDLNFKQLFAKREPAF